MLGYCEGYLHNDHIPDIGKMIKRFHLFLIRLGYNPVTVTDGWSFWPRWCDKCGGNIIVIRPGDARCEDCEN